jgi:hypothetical protein
MIGSSTIFLGGCLSFLHFSRATSRRARTPLEQGFRRHLARMSTRQYYHRSTEDHWHE